MKPHKHAELIKAWADGAEIERLSEIGDWLPDNDTPEWLEDVTYRIKPAEPVARWFWAIQGEGAVRWQFYSEYLTEAEAKHIFTPGLYKIRRLEWSREEFDE